MASDQSLLKRYASSRDADAFAELLRRYARLVYGVCLRTTGSPHDAEDVAQECFLELARSAGCITSSLPGWLHSLARSRSVDILRRAESRKRREERAMKEEASQDDLTWAKMVPHVDRALEELPEELRAPLILHYVLGRTQAEVAEELQVDQSNVSRRLKSGIEALRDRLGKLGVAVPVAILAGLLTENAAQAAPPVLMAALGKMAIAGVGGASSAGAGGAAVTTAATVATALGAVKLKLAVAAAAAVLSAGGVAAYLATSAGREERPPVAEGEREERPPAAEARAETPPKPPGALERKIDVSYHAARLPEVLDDLRAKTGLQSAYVRDTEAGFAFTFEGEGVTIPEVLSKLAEAGGLACDTTGDVVLLWSVRDEEVRRRLDGTSLAFEFVDTPLDETLHFLSVAGGAPIFLDERIDERRLKKPITLKVTDMPCRTALRWILKLAGLAYVVREGSIVVGSGEVMDTAEPPAAQAEGGLASRGPSEEVLALLDDALALPDGRVGRRARVGTLAPGEEPVARFLREVISRRDRCLLDLATWLVREVPGGPDSGETARRVKDALSCAGEKARREALAALGVELPKRATEFALLRVPDFFRRARRNAVYALARLPAEHAVRYLEAILDEGKGRDHELRVNAASLLAPIGGRKAFALAKRSLADESRAVRARALRALSEIGGVEALPLVEEALRDPEEWVRAAAAEGLGKIGGDPAAGGERVLSLLEGALGDPEWSVRRAAAGALGLVGRELPARREKELALILALLEKAQRDENELVRSYAGSALAEMGTDAAMALLVRTLREPGEYTAEGATARLAENRTARSLLMLVRILGMERLDYEEPAWMEELRRALGRKVSFEFAATRLPEATQSVQTLTKVKIVLDPTALKENDRASLRVTLRATDVPLADALGKLLGPAGLDYALKDQAVFVSTPERLAGARAEHGRARAAALEALDQFSGNFIRDSLVARAAVEPSVGMREDIVSRLNTFYGGDSAVIVALAWQATGEAKAERARRRVEIRAERLRQEGRPPRPDSPAESESAPGAVF